MTHFVKKEFNELTLAELYAILKLRMEIFLLEQRSFYLDMDDQDQQATHIFAVSTEHPSPICYGRIHVEKSIAQIGRVCVRKNLRHTGLGSALMNELMTHTKSLDVDAIELDAQIHLQAFYGKYGFQAIGEPYDDAGIMHILMRKVVGAAK